MIAAEALHPVDPYVADEDYKEKENYGGTVGSVQSGEELDPDGEVWIHPTEDEKSGPNALLRVVDKM